MAAKVHHWHSYLRVLQSRGSRRVEHFQKAENILLIVLEKVHEMDPRFTVEYSRNLEALEFSLSAAEDEVDMQLPLHIDADALLIQECSDKQSDADKVAHGNDQMQWSCYLGVPKEGTHLENWITEDVFSEMDSTQSRGHIVPGKVLCLLKELIVAAIVHCKRQSLIRPGEISAERLKEDTLQLPLLVSSGWKMLCFNIIPVVRRKQGAPELNNNWQERGFPQGSMSKLMEAIDFIPASYYHWRFSTSRPILKLIQNVSTLKGYRLDSLRVLVQVNQENWKEEGKERGLTFHHLKMVLLWATHFFPSAEDWMNLEGSVYRLLVILLCCLVTKNLPHFLYPKRNLFQGDGLDLSDLYTKVESFACSPAKFLKFYFIITESKGCHQKDNGLKDLLQLTADDKAYWDTAFFDMLLNKFQMYQIKDAQRISAMSDILSKTKKAVNRES